MKNTYVITGGTRGIGRAITIDFLSKGHTVYAIYARNLDEAQKLIDISQQYSGKLICVRGDLTIPEVMIQTTNQILDTVEAIHGIVHCAASGVHRLVDELKTKHLRWTYEVNVFSFHELLMRLLPKVSQNAKIIGLTSAGSSRYLQQYAAVGSSKGALDALFRHYAVELAHRKIGVNLVCPGMIETEAVKNFPNSEQRVSAAISLTPTGRLTTVEEVAELISFLVCVNHNQFTGQTFYIDGGKGLLA